MAACFFTLDCIEQADLQHQSNYLSGAGSNTSFVPFLFFIFFHISTSLCCCFSGRKAEFLENKHSYRERIRHIQTPAFHLSLLFFMWMSALILSSQILFSLACFPFLNPSFCCLSLSLSLSLTLFLITLCLSSSSLSPSSLSPQNHETGTLPASFNMCHNFDVAASFTVIYLLCCFGISVTLLLTCLRG